MALLPTEANKNLKRSSSMAGLEDSTKSKVRRTRTHHHKLHHQSHCPNSPSCALHDHAQSEKLLERSISLALEAVGFDAVEPLALQSFRALAEEYMAHVLSSVHKSMQASRRARSIPQDYLHALRAHRLSLRALQVHLDPPVPLEKSVLSLELDAGRDEESSFAAPDLSKVLKETASAAAPVHLPKHFPYLPSSHTYQSTSKFTPRESDPRKIRERATEEGRLGEAALQKFVGAKSKANQQDAEDVLLDGATTLRSKRHAAWKDAMMADGEDGDVANAVNVMAGTGAAGDRMNSQSRTLDVGPLVNADQAFLRKAVRTR